MSELTVMQNANLAPVANLMEVQAFRAQHEIQGAITMAKKMPRSVQRATEQISMACLDPKFAEEAMYSFPRGGSNVSGLSIRAAEMLARNWGNLTSGVLILSQSATESVVEAYCWDLESNWRVNRVFSVQHIRDTKKGVQVLTDQRDIYELVMNQGQRRHRACILAHIPGETKSKVEHACEQALLTEKTPLDQRIKNMLTAFATLGVTKEMVEKRAMKKAEALGPREVLALRKIFQSLQDGMSSIQQWFEGSAPMSGEGIAAPHVDPEADAKVASAKLEAMRKALGPILDRALAMGLDVNLMGIKGPFESDEKKTALYLETVTQWIKHQEQKNVTQPASAPGNQGGDTAVPVAEINRMKIELETSLKRCQGLDGKPMTILGVNPHNLLGGTVANQEFLRRLTAARDKIDKWCDEYNPTKPEGATNG